jgi:hypothetical protein
VATADWTYQVAPAGVSSEGLEEYVVEAVSGDPVGKVQTLLRRRDELLVAVERGRPPVSHDVRVLTWHEVERVDHDALTVRLCVSEDALDEALELDPDKGVELGDAEAARVTELPAELQPSPGAGGELGGPVDRPTYMGAVALGAAGLLSFLALAIAALRVDFGWEFVLFVVPLGLLAAAGIAGYRAFRTPYEGG